MSGRRGRPAGTAEALGRLPARRRRTPGHRGAGGWGGGFPEKPEVRTKEKLSWEGGREEEVA